MLHLLVIAFPKPGNGVPGVHLDPQTPWYGMGSPFSEDFAMQSLVDVPMAGFFFGAGKITQAQNNSRSKITQGFFKITQENFGKKLMVPEVFGLI